MDLFMMGSDVESLDGLGVSYEESALEARTVSSSSGRRRLVAAADERSAQPHGGAHTAGTDTTAHPAALDVARAASEAGDESTAHSSPGHPSPGAGCDGWSTTPPPGPYTHVRDGSLGFTFSGEPTDVVRFRSCIPPSMTRARGGAGGEGAAPPEPRGPFPADILNVILLYVCGTGTADILEVSRVCRFWRYYANFAPHWTFFRRREWQRREDSLAPYLRAIVARPKVMTREEYFTERRRVEVCQRRDRILDYVKHVRWCVAMAIMAAAMATANFVVAYTLGFLRTALRSDAKLGATTAVLMIAMTLLEVTVVMIPLGGVSSPSNKDGMIRILSWGLVILDIGLVLGIVTALAFTRVQANGRVLDGGTMDFTMTADCTVYPSSGRPSFALLPALLWDLRWQPITMDPTATTLKPYCLRKPRDERTELTQCYVLMYFDAAYASDVFQNASALWRWRDTGAATALGFDPLTGGRPMQGVWCAESDGPQVIALTASTYDAVAAERNKHFPKVSDWLSPAQRPSTYGAISYRCSSNINRETTESPRGSTDMWYQYSDAWRRHYVPLITPLRQLRSTFKESHDHFLNYAFRCYIISACIWGVQLLAQCLVKDAALDVLGATATATLILFNPLSLMTSGALCVFVDHRDFMCDDGSGYGLMGSGVALLLTMATIFVVVYD